jgi:hypothetical protein
MNQIGIGERLEEKTIDNQIGLSKLIQQNM